jgi:hypothetical protein
VGGQGLALLDMAKNPRNQGWILNAGNHPECAAAFGAALDVDKVN